MEFTDRCDLAPARDRGQQRGQKEGGLRTWEVGFSKWFLRLKIFDFLFFSSLLVCRTRRSHVGTASAHVEKKKKKEDTRRTPESDESYLFQCPTRVRHQHDTKNGVSVQPRMKNTRSSPSCSKQLFFFFFWGGLILFCWQLTRHPF